MLLSRRCCGELLQARRAVPTIAVHKICLCQPQRHSSRLQSRSAQSPMHIAAPASVATSAVPSLTSIETSSVSADASNRALYIALAYMTFSTTHELEKIMQLLNPDAQYKSETINIEVSGRDNIKSMMSGFFSKFTDVTWEVRSMSIVGKEQCIGREAVRVLVKFTRRMTDPDSKEYKELGGYEWLVVDASQGPPAGRLLMVHVGPPETA